MRHLVRETNHYADETSARSNYTRGGPYWVLIDVRELCSYMGISMLMRVKNMDLRSYWATSIFFLYCPIISSKMTQNRFKAITRCLHITNPSMLEIDNASCLYDKIDKVRWLVDECKIKFRSSYNLSKLFIVDEMMFHYKGKLCPIWQYMPMKPIK